MSLADFASNYDIMYNPGKRKNVIKLQNKKGYIVKRGSPAVSCADLVERENGASESAEVVKVIEAKELGADDGV